LVLSPRHVAAEVVDVREEVFVGEDILLVGVRDEEVVKSRRALSKNLIASLPYRIARDGVSEAYCPSYGAHRRTGWGRLRRRSALE
jgi:hypothetical protein